MEENPNTYLTYRVPEMSTYVSDRDGKLALHISDDIEFEELTSGSNVRIELLKSHGVTFNRKGVMFFAGHRFYRDQETLSLAKLKRNFRKNLQVLVSQNAKEQLSFFKERKDEFCLIMAFRKNGYAHREDRHSATAILKNIQSIDAVTATQPIATYRKKGIGGKNFALWKSIRHQIKGWRAMLQIVKIHGFLAVSDIIVIR